MSLKLYGSLQDIVYEKIKQISFPDEGERTLEVV